MNIAVRFDNKDREKEFQDAKADCEAIKFMKNYGNRSVTENGALGYRTTGHELLDLNFKVSSLRNRTEAEIEQYFARAYYEERKYAVKWLFFLRDILEGLGERRSFRVCLSYLAQTQPKTALAIFPLVAEYGRYDDLLCLLETGLCEDVCKLLKTQLDADIKAMKKGKPISLLAKWLPSENTSSNKTKDFAKIVRTQFGMTAREYRKTLSALRSYGNVVEVKMSASEWDAIEYDKVPAKANLKYEVAFEKHDLERRVEYLKEVLENGGKINVNGVMPYEIVHKMMDNRLFRVKQNVVEQLLAEIMWKKLLENGFKNDWGLEQCIVVADGSGSMFKNVSGETSVQAIEVCNSLAIYFAEQLSGVFHNKAITFSARPQFIDLSKGESLKEKLEIMLAHNEVANTNIEAVFMMLLEMAMDNHVPREQLPKQVLIISDMEFDMATGVRHQYFFGRTRDTFQPFNQTLFDTIEKLYEEAGYQMPRLIFWNVCGRSDTIPKVDNEQGICLLSGFSQNAMKIAQHKEMKDPYESLLKVLDSERYDKVEEALKAV